MSLKEKEDTEDKPPLFRSWSRLYLLVILQLAVTVLIFYLITRYFQ